MCHTTSEANHPAVESFHDVKSFAKINEGLTELGHTEIDWLPTLKKRKQQESTSSTTTTEVQDPAEESSSTVAATSSKKQKK